MIFRFDRFALDSAKFELRADGRALVPQPQPQAMRVLLLLAERGGELVTKEKAIDEIWGGRAISDDALSSQIKALRKIMGDAAKPYAIIGTVHGKGYRLLPEISRSEAATFRNVEELEPVEAGEPMLIGHPPSIAVLPFRLIGTAGPHGGLADALPDEIITALSRLRSMHVIARGSSFQFPSIMTDLGTVKERLGAEYCLSGTIDIVGDRIHISVELADTAAKTVVWSERFDTALAGVHEIREEIVTQTVSGIDFHIPLNEVKRTRLRVPSQMTAWEAYHAGISNIFTIGRPDYMAANGFFARALEIDPGFARAHAGTSHIQWWQMLQQASNVGPQTRGLMLDSAQRAIDCDPLDPFANLVRGRAAWLGEELEQGLGWFNRSIQLCPSYAMAHGALANLFTLSGDADAALPHVTKATDLSPVDPWLHNMHAIRSACHIQREEFEEAADWAQAAMRLPHDSLIVALCSLVAMHWAGRHDEAKRIAGLVRSANPQPDRAGITSTLPIFSPKFLTFVDEAFAAYKLS